MLCHATLSVHPLKDIVAALEAHGLTALSETQDVTPEVSVEILKAAL